VNGVFLIVAGIIVAVSTVQFYRMWKGGTAFDRVLAVGAIGTNAVALLVVVGFAYGRPEMFVDLALTYALLNFIAFVAIAKFLGQRGGEEA